MYLQQIHDRLTDKGVLFGLLWEFGGVCFIVLAIVAGLWLLWVEYL